MDGYDFLIIHKSVDWCPSSQIPAQMAALLKDFGSEPFWMLPNEGAIT